MKIKTKVRSFEEVMALPRPKHKTPKKPHWLFRSLVRVASEIELLPARFTHTTERMEEAGDGPYFILMNHSSFIDLCILARVFYPKPYSIITTSDGFVGKEWLMRQIGCVPTQKFVTDLSLIRDMSRIIKKEKTSVVMYPEASYSFDGCATTLPRNLGKLFKMLGVPVVTVITEGAFSRDPLYNGLQKRRVRVSAHVKCLFTAEEVQSMSVEALDRALDEAFSFDHFRWQKENGIHIREKFRADGLERILYKCAHCRTEGKMVGRGTTLRCEACGKTYEMDTLGQLHASEGETEFSHIPDWYRWERACVREEILAGTYRMENDVKIGMMVDYRAIYFVGEGHLTHDGDGFTLTGCDGKLSYHQNPQSSYGLYADYLWYEIADVICIGNSRHLFYCFPHGGGIVAKARLAAEEMYKIGRAEKREHTPAAATV